MASVDMGAGRPPRRPTGWDAARLRSGPRGGHRRHRQPAPRGRRRRRRRTSTWPTAGPAARARFPDGINVEFIAAGPGADALTLRVWERGAGITEACGTGACRGRRGPRLGLVGERVRVDMPGGTADGRARPCTRPTGR